MFCLQVFALLVSSVSTPLLEEKWDFGSQALIQNILDPFLSNWISQRGLHAHRLL